MSQSQSLYDVSLPYVPVPCEEIYAYTKLSDYAENRIKKISTVGIWNALNRSEAVLYPPPNVEQNTEIKLDLSEPFEETCGEIRSDPSSFFKVRAARVFGKLETRNEDIVLVVHHCLPVQDVERCDRILRLAAKVARQTISLYRYDPETNPEIRHLIDEKNARNTGNKVGQKRSNRNDYNNHEYEDWQDMDHEDWQDMQINQRVLKRLSESSIEEELEQSDGDHKGFGKRERNQSKYTKSSNKKLK